MSVDLAKNVLFQSNANEADTYSKRLTTMLFLLYKAKCLTPEAQDMWGQVVKILNKINDVIDHPDDDENKLKYDATATFDFGSCTQVKLYEPYTVTQDEMDEYKDCCSGDKAQARLNKLMKKLQSRMNAACYAACEDEGDLEDDFKDDVEEMIADLMCDSNCNSGKIDFNDGGFEGGDLDHFDGDGSDLSDKQHRMKLLHYLYWVMHHVRWRMECTKTSDGTTKIEKSTKEDKDAQLVLRLMWKWIQLLDRMSKLAISDYTFSKPVSRDSCFDDDDDSVCCKFESNCDRDDSLDIEDTGNPEGCGQRKSDFLKNTLESLLEKCIE